MKKNDFTTINNYKRITLPSLIVILIVGAILFFILYQFNYNIVVTDVAAYLTGSIAIVTLVNFSKSIDKVNEFHEKTLKVNKDQYSFNVVAEIHKDYIKDSFRAFRNMDAKLSLSNLPVKDLLNHFKNNPNDEGNMLQVLNYFEHVSLLIIRQQVDEKIIKDSFKTLFIRVHMLSKNYIEYKQIDSYTLWCNYCLLAKKWEGK